jgi:hypothetical protein
MDGSIEAYSDSDKRVRASMRTSLGQIILRDLGVEDIEANVRYWHASSHEHLDLLGINRSRLGTSVDTRQRLLHAIWTGDLNQQSLAFTITVDGDFAGYTLLKGSGLLVTI